MNTFAGRYGQGDPGAIRSQSAGSHGQFSRESLPLPGPGHETGERPGGVEGAVDWDELRRVEFPVAERWAYFDHAAVAPLPRRSGDAMRAWVEEQEYHGCVHWPQWERRLEANRHDLSRLIGAEADEIA